MGPHVPSISGATGKEGEHDRRGTHVANAQGKCNRGTRALLSALHECPEEWIQIRPQQLKHTYPSKESHCPRPAPKGSSPNMHFSSHTTSPHSPTPLPSVPHHFSKPSYSPRQISLTTFLPFLSPPSSLLLPPLPFPNFYSSPALYFISCCPLSSLFPFLAPHSNPSLSSIISLSTLPSCPILSSTASSHMHTQKKDKASLTHQLVGCLLQAVCLCPLGPWPVFSMV